jgi:hypothetical protein
MTAEYAKFKYGQARIARGEPLTVSAAAVFGLCFLRLLMLKVPYRFCELTFGPNWSELVRITQNYSGGGSSADAGPAAAGDFALAAVSGGAIGWWW